MTPINDYLSKVNHVSTTAGYIAHKDFYDKLITNFREGCAQLMKGDDQPNYAIDMYWKHLQKVSNWYIFNPSVGYQRESFSDINGKNVVT